MQKNNVIDLEEFKFSKMRLCCMMCGSREVEGFQDGKSLKGNQLFITGKNIDEYTHFPELVTRCYDCKVDWVLMPRIKITKKDRREMKREYKAYLKEKESQS